jgi:hypothetical protein
MSLTERGYSDRFWRDRQMLRRLAGEAKVPDHIYGWSTASTNRFEGVEECLRLLTILAENQESLLKSGIELEMTEDDFVRLRHDFRDLSDETDHWIGLFRQLSTQAESLSDKIREMWNQAEAAKRREI